MWVAATAPTALLWCNAGRWGAPALGVVALASLAAAGLAYLALARAGDPRSRSGAIAAAVAAALWCEMWTGRTVETVSGGAEAHDLLAIMFLVLIGTPTHLVAGAIYLDDRAAARSR